MKKYTALRALSWFYLIVAGVILFDSIILSGLTMVTSSFSYDFATGEIQQGAPLVGAGIGIILSAVLSLVTLAAFAQLLQVIIEMLDNSRKQIKLLKFIACQSK